MRLRTLAVLLVVVSVLFAGVLPMVVWSVTWWSLPFAFAIGLGAATSLYISWRTGEGEMRERGLRW